VAATASAGYANTTVSDLIAIAGVSRSTFYKYFADKEACFLATLEVIVAGVVAITGSRLRGDDSLGERAERGMEAFLSLLAAQPAAARLCVVEAYAAGPKAIAIVEGAAAEFEAMIGAVFNELPEQRGMPPEMVKTMVGGVQKVLHTRLHRGTEKQLLEMAPDLVQLGLLYRPPPKPLPRPRRRARAAKPVLPSGYDEPAERIELATMAVVARRGYQEATMAEIVAEAGTSFRTFYSAFDSKASAFDAALMRARLRMEAATIPAFRRAKTWPEGVVALTHTSLAFLESEPDFARLISVDVYSAGGAALESRDRAIESTRHLIEVGLRRLEFDNPIAAEAIQSGLYGMLANRVRDERRPNLAAMAPLAIYMTLVPFLGPDAAYAHATGRKPRS
jgi:AcrR family transcriptional regulator